jgi:hypothetical protein
MNRIYQGRVSKVEIPKPGDKDNPWQPLPNWQDILWQHHELFQDAVNYYTVCLLALASSEANPLTKIRQRIEATAANPKMSTMSGRRFLAKARFASACGIR